MPELNIGPANPELTSNPFWSECAWAQVLSAGARKLVAVEAYESFHPRGQAIALQGNDAHSWLGVRSGLLKIQCLSSSGKTVMFTGVPPGSWIGEGSLLKDEPRRYDVIALRDSAIVHVPRHVFRRLLDAEPAFARFLLSLLNERLSQYIGMLEAERFADPVARLARSIAAQLNPVLYPRGGPRMYMSQEEFGELAGLSRQTTNISMKALERAGLLKAHYGYIDVLDPQGLAAKNWT